MSTFTNNNVASGDVVRASDHNTQGANIAAVVNGNIEADNLAANAVTTAKIADGAVTNAKLATTAGELGGAWQDWIPTYTNMALGNGTVAAEYTQIGKTINARFKFTLGSTSTVGASPTISLPVAANSAYGSDKSPVGSGFYDDSNSGDITGFTIIEASTTHFTPILTGSFSRLSSTAPFTWATGDIITCSFTYEAA